MLSPPSHSRLPSIPPRHRSSMHTRCPMGPIIVYNVWLELAHPRRSMARPANRGTTSPPPPLLPAPSPPFTFLNTLLRGLAARTLPAQVHHAHHSQGCFSGSLPRPCKAPTATQSLSRCAAALQGLAGRHGCQSQPGAQPLGKGQVNCATGRGAVPAGPGSVAQARAAARDRGHVRG